MSARGSGLASLVMGLLGVGGASSGFAVVSLAMQGSHSESDTGGTTGFCLGALLLGLEIVAIIIAAMALRAARRTSASAALPVAGLVAACAGLAAALGLMLYAILALTVNSIVVG
ncbi:hypothetical protein GPROT1_02837 [Gammaproteobacteria bacterium]|nr:hypothetical protein GPROT1_02837 [Gammaproteobacteria bacterium]